MEQLTEELKSLNKFLKKTHFDIDVQFIKLRVKINLVNIKEYILVGDWKKHVQYEIIILKNGSVNYGLLNQIFGWKNEIEITTTERPLQLIIYKTDDILDNFFRYFGINYSSMCIKIIKDKST
mgnify:CR=1 FL=1